MFYFPSMHPLTKMIILTPKLIRIKMLQISTESNSDNINIIMLEYIFMELPNDKVSLKKNIGSH